MALTTAQLATLKAAILADPVLNALPNTNVGNSVIAVTLNAPATPAFIVWKTVVQSTRIGKTVNYVAVAAMTTANLERLNNFLGMNPSDFDPARADIRTFMADTFSGALGGQGQATRDALEALYRRAALAAEKIFSTGTGSTASPAVVGREGPITPDEIEQARAS
jgi:hypothetical protein